jgi:hypothetical protein
VNWSQGSGSNHGQPKEKVTARTLLETDEAMVDAQHHTIEVDKIYMDVNDTHHSKKYKFSLALPEQAD